MHSRCCFAARANVQREVNLWLTSMQRITQIQSRCSGKKGRTMYCRITYHLLLSIGQHRCIPCLTEVVREQIDIVDSCVENCRQRPSNRFPFDMRPKMFRTANWWNLVNCRRPFRRHRHWLVPLNCRLERPELRCPNYSVRTNWPPL